MTEFVVIFIGLIALVLVLAPLAWRQFRDLDALNSEVRSAQETVARTLREAENYRMACEHASDGLLIQDMQGRIEWANQAYCALHGYDLEDLLGRNPMEYALPPDEKPSQDSIEKFRYDRKDPAWKGLKLFKNLRRDGSLFWNQINVSFRKSATGRENAILVCRDVSDDVQKNEILREARKKLQHEATHDSLTGLPNRSAVMSFLENTLADPSTLPIGIMHVDLDHFKDINDTHGHSAGDHVLRSAAKALHDVIDETEMVARVGGDEFVVVCPNISDLSSLRERAEAALDRLSQPTKWSNCILVTKASVGAALARDAGTNVADMLLRSDFALYEAKRQGRNRVALYDEVLHARHTEQLQRSTDLVDTINANGLTYYFQPKMDVRTGEIASFETLVRWIHPEHGLIPPDEFLPMVKSLGLMTQLDLQSMRAAIDHKARLNAAGFGHIGIAFNASPELLAQPDFIDNLNMAVDAQNLRPHEIAVEVLETTDFGSDDEGARNIAMIKKLRDLGYQILLDDFGVGHAGLTHLSRLNVSGVKIDKGLIMPMLTDEVSRKIVRKTVELSNDLGLTVIAEGIEDEETAALLRDMGCQITQGYWIARPMPAPDSIEWISNWFAPDLRKRA